LSRFSQGGGFTVIVNRTRVESAPDAPAVP